MSSVSERIKIRLLDQSFDPGEALGKFHSELSDLNMIGAVVSFSGIVRDNPAQKRLMALELEHYPGMTEKMLQEIAIKAKEKFSLQSALILHRIGHIPLGEPIMMVACASSHRAEAFKGADYMMDFLKSRAPFWKKEHYADGSEWVKARSSDEEALARWF